MHIGLIGGIGPAATDYYYQNIIRTFAAKRMLLDLTMVHTDASTLLNNLAGNKVSDQVAIYERLTKRLAQSGADCVVVTSIAGHFCIDAFKEISSLPVIDMIEEVNKAVSKLGLGRIGILGTKTVMETKFYGKITSAEIIPPKGTQLDAVHNAYATMAAAGTVNDNQRAVFADACNSILNEYGAEAIMLGGTDLALVYNQENTALPIVDCAEIHCDAIVEWVSKA